MNNFFKIGGIAVALVVMIVLAGATAAFAQVPDQAGATGPHRNGDGLNLMAVDPAEMHEAIADALGMSLEEFDAALAAGKTPYVLAQELGVDFADVLAAMDALHAQALQQAVADGLITQEQADWMLSRRGGQGTGQGTGRQGAGGPGNGGAGNSGANGAGLGAGQGRGPNGTAGGSGYNGDCPYPTS